jgi:hypothetical protein
MPQGNTIDSHGRAVLAPFFKFHPEVKVEGVDSLS